MGQKIIAGLIGAAFLSPFGNIYISAGGFILAWMNFSDFIEEPKKYPIE